MKNPHELVRWDRQILKPLGEAQRECKEVDFGWGLITVRGMSAEALERAALALPASGRALLVGKLLASLSGEVDSAIERANLDEVAKRRAAAKEGKATFIDGGEAISRARAAVQK